MAQFAFAGGPRSSAGVLTVADILRRNAPVPVKVQGSQNSAPLSVGSLLEREGFASQAMDGADDVTTFVPRAVPAAGRTVKRGAIAAGTLLAAGSVFGATVLTDASAIGQDSAAGPYAGHGILDGSTDPAAPGVVISPAANTGTLDAGTGAPSSWVPVAFPSALAGTSDGVAAPTAKKAPTAGNPATSPAGSSSQAGGGTSNTPTGGSGSGGSTGGSGSGGSGSGGAASSNGLGGTVAAATGGVGGAVNNVGSAVPGPVGGLVQGVGDTVTGTGKALGSTVDTVTQPVTSALQPVTQPVTSLIGGLVSGLLG